MNKKIYHFFIRSNKNNRGKIDHNFNSFYSALFDYTYALTGDIDESRNIVKNALADACKVKADLDRNELIEFLFKKVDPAVEVYYEERPQMQRFMNLLNEPRVKIRRCITKQELLKAFHDEVENLPSERKNIISLFFCGLNTLEVAEKTGKSEDIVLYEKRKAIEDVLNALNRKGFVFIDGQGC